MLPLPTPAPLCPSPSNLTAVDEYATFASVSQGRRNKAMTTNQKKLDALRTQASALRTAPRAFGETEG